MSERESSAPGRIWPSVLLLAGAAALAVPAAWFRGAGVEASPVLQAVVYGHGIIGGAFILAWASEVAQLDISQALAVAILAVVAVLPEYAVDLVLAWRAAERPSYGAYVMANMTGANRLLVGVGWPLVVVLFWARFRKRGIEVGKGQAPAIAALGVATLYSFLIAAKGVLAWWDAVPLVGFYGLYLWRIARQGMREPQLYGPSATIGRLPGRWRKPVVVGMFVLSGAAILASAEPFAEALIESGSSLGVSEYLLVQWVAPLASESPELLIVAFWTWRGLAEDGLQALISSKVNQWLLLVGTIPLVYSVSLGAAGALDLDRRQTEEVLLTGAQSLLAVFLLSSLDLSVLESALLFVLFAAQLVVPEIRMEVTWAYLALSAVYLVIRRRALFSLMRAAFPGGERG